MATLEDIIADEWQERAPELADWAMQHLVNRRDVWGQYSVLTPGERRKTDRTYKAMTLPATDSRDTMAEMVTLDKLTRHFASRHHRRPQLIGLHAKSQADTSRWFGIDVDNHAESASRGDDLARRNLHAVVQWHTNLQQQGFDPLLFDSNGAGGFHLWVLFQEPAPTADVHAMARAVTADWESLNLAREPEVFPKALKDDSLGAWFRLPGLHHTRPHHARLWGGDDLIDDPWLTGHAAIDAMLAVMPGPPPPKADTHTSAGTRATAKRPTGPAKTDAQPGDPVPVLTRVRRSRANRPRVCVDLDGVLAHRTGKDAIGPPIEGAVEFTRELQEFAELVVYTARFSTRSGKTRSNKATSALKQRLERWLTQHGFAWDSINTGTAKPIASAYIDDRAVPCQPVDDGLQAFNSALQATRTLTNEH